MIGQLEALKNKKIIIIDDEQDICEILSVELEACGAILSVFDSVDTAYEYLLLNKVDLVVSDYNLKRKTGLDLLAGLEQAGVSRPFVFISGSFDIDVSQAFAMGAKAFLSKPFQMKDFLNSCVRALLTKAELWSMSEVDLQQMYSQQFVNAGRVELNQDILESTAAFALGKGGFYLKKSLLADQSQFKKHNFFRLQLHFKSNSNIEVLDLLVRKLWKKSTSLEQDYIGLEILSLYSDNKNKLLVLSQSLDSLAYIPAMFGDSFAKSQSANSKSRLG